jgi:hypothetical protein
LTNNKEEDIRRNNMGTSHAAKAPTTVRWAKVSGSLRAPERNARTVLGATLSAVIPWIPAGYVVQPVVSVVAGGIRFALEVKEKGLSQAARSEGIHIPERFLAFGISEGLWKIATASVPPQFINTPYGRLAEIAFKKTLSSILVKGIKAMEGLE